MKSSISFNNNPLDTLESGDFEKVLIDFVQLQMIKTNISKACMIMVHIFTVKQRNIKWFFGQTLYNSTVHSKWVLHSALI